MSFTSIYFWLIFPIVFGVYWLIPNRFNVARNVFLVVVSYLLYMNWKPAFAVVLLSVSLITYIGGYLLGTEQSVGKRKLLVWCLALLALLPLLTFKYYNFINDSISNGLALMGLKFSLPGLNWAMPVGISFFSFQAVGYMLDVYHQRVKPERNIIDYLLFVSFFPQVTSGPISKADELLPQIKNPHLFDYTQAKQGLKFLLWGMFLKLVIADRSGIFVDTVYSNFEHFNGTTCFVANVLYTIQIYCDSGGYSLMAIGIARTLGFNLIDNFRRPYLAVSVTDFWKRWHISLTRWLTQQIYIPLGGSRCTKARNYLNIMITFLVSGIWHGANWTFVFWGTIHGLIQIIEKHLGWQKHIGSNALIKAGRICLTFLFLSFALVFFRMTSIQSAFVIIGKMVTDVGVPALSGMGNAQWLMLIVGLAMLGFKELREEFFSNKFHFIDTRSVRWAVYICLFCLILSFGVLDGGQFIYASF